MVAIDETLLRPHALLMPWPALGHINPMLQLASRLTSQAFIVTFVHAQRTTPSPLIPNSPLLRFFSIDDGISPHQSSRPSPAQFHEGVNRLERGLYDLMHTQHNQGSPVSCIISDNFLPWTQDVANAFGIPRVEFWTSSVSGFSVFFHTPLLISQGYLPIKGEIDENFEAKDPVITCVPGVSSLHLRDLPHEILVDDLQNPAFKFFTSPFKRVREAACVLVNSFYDLEYRVIDALRADKLPIVPVGPLLPPDFWGAEGYRETELNDGHRQESDECLLWLDLQSPSSVLYISFGTIGTMGVAEIHQLALGLEASELPFLWVLRLPPGETSTSSGTLPEGFLARTMQQGRVIAWAPQLSVLCHPSVGGFLTHCGWNSVLESICSGVPMLGWPRRADQMMNLRMVTEEWKVGIAIQKQGGGEVGREEVEGAVRLLMQGGEGKAARMRARELRDAARRAMSEEGGGDSVMGLNKFMEEMKRGDA